MSSVRPVVPTFTSNSDQWQLVEDFGSLRYVWGQLGRDDLVWREHLGF